MSDSMNVRNCRKCGRIFNYVVGPILCPRCVEEQEKVFQVVKEYVIEHHGADIAEVSRECNVEPSQIQQWLREERLELTEGSAIYLQCEKCGAPIRSGRFCEKCKYEMSMDLQSVLPKKQQMLKQHPTSSRDGDRMRYL